MPQRFCYAGSVFRYIEPQAGRQREFSQAGIELIGAAKPAADAEVLALTADALSGVGLASFRLVIGQMQYFSGLLEDLKLAPDSLHLLQRAVNSNSEAALADFLRETPLRTQQRRTVEELPALNGPHADAIIALADRHCLNYPMHAAVANLRAIFDHLDRYGVADTVYVDLTEINNLGYYTGITFEALAPGLGFTVASGGRYDNLVGTFGAPQPAVGVAIGIDRLLFAAHEPTDLAPAIGPEPPDAMVVVGKSGAAMACVLAWRQRGLHIVVDLCEASVDELCQFARQTDIPRLLIWSGDGFDVYSPQEEAVAKAHWDLNHAQNALGGRHVQR